MELRPAFQLQAAIKALADVVLPSVDPTNKLAQEQGHLVLAMLKLMAQRMPLQYRYDRFELSQFLALAETLTQQQSGLASDVSEAQRELLSSLAKGRDVLDRSGIDPEELEKASFDLREKIGTLVTACAMSPATDAEQRKHLNTAVIAHAGEQLLRERAWLSPQGWEPGAGLPEVETLIGG